MKTLNKRHFEKLAKIINRGTGRAVQGFYEVIGERQPYWLEKSAVSIDSLQLSASHYGVVAQEFDGPFSAKVLLLFTAQSVQRVLRKVLGEEMDAQGLSDVESEVMREMGNIMVNGCLSAIADQLHILLESTVTHYHQFENSDIVALIENDEQVSNVLVTQVNLMVSGVTLEGGKLFMLLNENSTQGIAEKIDALLG